MTEQAKGDDVNLSTERIFIKDVSFEAPNSPQIFREKWEPEVSVNFQVETDSLGDDFYEVVLQVTLEVKNEEETAFLVEVHQGGVFHVEQADEEQLDVLQYAYCPYILYPYASHQVAHLIQSAGFPSLYLPPVNFDAIYEESLKSEQTDNSVQ